ncbi:MAG: pyridoxamine kinase [Clostridiales bacterium]|nr:pyridoxamine kinase [Clostridiales bacterium]
MKKVAVINDISGFGRCSLTAALPVLSALGVQCCPLPTAVLTGQTGYSYFHCTDLTDMTPQYTDAWGRNGERFDAIYTGYMTGAAQLKHVLDFVDHFYMEEELLLVDPVMGDGGHVYGMYSDELLAGMKELVRRADIITPNLTEACLLADIPIETAKDDRNAFLTARKASREIVRSLGNKEIVITGIPHVNALGRRSICNLVAGAESERTLDFPYFDRSFSGTGDLFASVVCGCKLNGIKTEDAVQIAGEFLCLGIEDTINTSSDPNDGVFFESHIGELIEAVKEIKQ